MLITLKWSNIVERS